MYTLQLLFSTTFTMSPKSVMILITLKLADGLEQLFLQELVVVTEFFFFYANTSDENMVRPRKNFFQFDKHVFFYYEQTGSLDSASPGTHFHFHFYIRSVKITNS